MVSDSITNASIHAAPNNNNNNARDVSKKKRVRFQFPFPVYDLLLFCIRICIYWLIFSKISRLFGDFQARSAKLKQCKLDVRREQWLSQGTPPIS